MYRIILMDCSMPIMDGWRATRLLKSFMETGKIPYMPIIGLTAFTSKSDVDECIRSGMNEVFQKPLQVAKFKELLVKYKAL
jgi:CheY-like chemotaxis protein